MCVRMYMQTTTPSSARRQRRQARAVLPTLSYGAPQPHVHSFWAAGVHTVLCVWGFLLGEVLLHRCWGCRLIDGALMLVI